MSSDDSCIIGPMESYHWIVILVILFIILLVSAPAWVGFLYRKIKYRGVPTYDVIPNEQTYGLWGKISGREEEQILEAVSQLQLLGQRSDGMSMEAARRIVSARALKKDRALRSMMEAVSSPTAVGLLSGLVGGEGSASDYEAGGHMARSMYSIVIFHGTKGVVDIGYYQKETKAEIFTDRLSKLLKVELKRN